MRIFTEKELENEEWEPLVGFENYCEASSLGRIRTLDRSTISKIGITKFIKGRILTLGYYSNGYEQFSIRVDGKRFTAIVHRLIALTFLPNPFNKDEVNHKNGIRDDNRVINLEWSTKSENIRHSFDVLNRKHKDSTGSKNPKATLNEQQVLDIRKLYKKKIKTQIQLATMYKVTRAVIWKVVTKYTWKHI